MFSQKIGKNVKNDLVETTSLKKHKVGRVGTELKLISYSAKSVLGQF
jgi:hypothetical protein